MTVYVSGPFVCDFPGCYDHEPHQHSHKSLMERILLLSAENESIRSQLAAKSAECERLRECLIRVGSRAQESADCASGKKVHNPDGDGDEMCEEGLCFEPGWEDNIKDINAALAPRAEKPAGEVER